MKKTILFLLIAAIFWPGIHRLEAKAERLFANVHLTLWKLENGPAEAARRINTPIPDVYRESMLSTWYSRELIVGKSSDKSYTIDNFSIILKAENPHLLTVVVFEKEKERFELLMKDGATLHTIFYDEASRAYLLEVGVSFADHPVGLVSPGIRR